eukprot:8892403-Karenia_brevis.AAC.1
MCVPVLHDSGATCNCIKEEQMVIIISHVSWMLEEGKMSIDDYNYPLKQFYKYKNIAKMKGAEAKASLVIEYAVELRI